MTPHLFGIQQATLIKWKYTLTDVVILDYLRGLFRAKKIVKVMDTQGTVYYYIDCKKAVEYLPILGINAQTFRRYLTKYYKAGILIRKELHLPVPPDIEKTSPLSYHEIYYYNFSGNKQFQQLFNFHPVV